MTTPKFPVPDTLVERAPYYLDFYYTEAYYASYPSYLAALTRLGW